jgi:hypothetical protein
MLTQRLSPAPAAIAIAALCFPGVLHAQFTGARTYAQGPVDLNELEFTYEYASANASIDTSLVVGSANLDLNLTPSLQVGEAQYSQARRIGYFVPLGALELFKSFRTVFFLTVSGL